MKAFEVSKKEREKYVLKEKRDFEILQKCKELTRKKLASCEARVIHLIKTQLKDDWREPLLTELKRIEKKYK